MFRLVVKNFLGLIRANIETTERIVGLLGPNGAGKSSAGDAIRYALGDKIRGTASGDRAALGYHGERFSVDLALTDHFEFHATKSSIPKIAEVADTMGVSRNAIPYCLDGSAFLRASDKDLRALLGEILKVDVDFADELIKRGCDAGLVASLPEDRAKAKAYAEARRAENRASDPGEGPEDTVIVTKSGEVKASDIDAVELQREIEDLRREIILKTAEVANLEALGDPGDLDVAEIESKLEAFRKDRAAIEIPIDKIRQAKDEKQKSIEEYNKLEGRSVEVAKLKEKVREWLEVDLCEKCRKKIESLELKRQGQVDGIEKHKEKLVERISETSRRMIELEKQQTAAEERIRDLDERISNIEQVKRAVNATTRIVALKAEIQDLTDRAANGDAILATVRVHNEMSREYEAKVAAYKANDNARRRWDQIAKTIPDVEQAAVSSGLDRFREIVARQTMLSDGVQIADDLTITYSGRPLNLASKSEQYRVGLALQWATLELFGFPFMLIDETDILVSDEVKAAFSADVQAIAESRPVIYIQTRDEAPAASPDGVELYWIENGQAERIKR